MTCLALILWAYAVEKFAENGNGLCLWSWLELQLGYMLKFKRKNNILDFLYFFINVIEKIDQDRRREELDILLVEYQKAQDSAEHHDYLSWIATSILAGGMLILLGGMIEPISQMDQTQRAVLIMASLLGLILSFIFLSFLILSFRNKKNAKYKRCQDIEEEIERKFSVQMINHLMFQPKRIKRNEVNIPKTGASEGYMTLFFFIFLIFPLSGAWLYIFYLLTTLQWAFNIGLLVGIIELFLLIRFPDLLGR